MAGTAAKGLVQHGFVLRQGGGPDGLPHIPLLREENFGVEQEGLEALRAFFWNGDSSSSLQNRQRPVVGLRYCCLMSGIRGQHLAGSE